MASKAKVKTEPTGNVSGRILALCSEFADSGVSDKLLQTTLTDVESKVRAEAINKLLGTGKIELFRSEKGLLYKRTDEKK